MNFLTRITFHKKLMTLLGIHFSLYLYALVTQWDWSLFLFMLIFHKIWHLIGNEAGLHRLWAHKSYQTQRWKEYILQIFAVPLLYGTSITYAGIHRQHHAYSDTEKDPHVTRPWWKVAFYIRNKDYDIETRFVKDLLRDPLHIWTHRNYFKINFLLVILCLLVLGPVWTGYTLSFIVIHSFVGAATLNVLGHRPEYGKRPHNTNDQSSNNWFVQIISLNEGLHNQHHANPGAWSFMNKKTNVDLGAWIIYLFFMTPEQKKKAKFVW
ncbi:MAG: hypothetical protein EBV10_02630 [Synechococcaceae bacterium WB6_1A_059]|nr:hypothetical protein [Synechococcaceae bacterium WB6_1A_059]